MALTDFEVAAVLLRRTSVRSYCHRSFKVDKSKLTYYDAKQTVPTHRIISDLRYIILKAFSYRDIPIARRVKCK